MFVMVSYDVPAKRTGMYKKILKEFLIHEQASVFMGEFGDRSRLQRGLRRAC